MECRQQWAGEARVARFSTTTAGTVYRAPDGGHVVYPRAIQMASIQRGHFRYRRPRRLHTGYAGASHCTTGNLYYIKYYLLPATL